MSATHPSTEEHHEPGRYEIRLKGHLDTCWADQFAGLSFTHASNGTTILAGPVVDQAALYGLLRKVRDLGLPLVSVMRIQGNPWLTGGAFGIEASVIAVVLGLGLGISFLVHAVRQRRIMRGLWWRGGINVLSNVA